jgi:hypothetical protein
MTEKYKVEENESIESIAKAHGLLPESLKSYEDNSAASSDNVFLSNGEVISVRDIVPKSISASTAARHTYVRKFGLLAQKICPCAKGLEFGTKERKVKLPVDEKWGTELYVIAGDEKSNRLYSTVTTSVVGGKSCPKGEPGNPIAIVKTSEERLETIQSDVKVFATKAAGLGDFVPAFQLIKYVFDLIVEGDHPVGVGTSRLTMCNLPSELADTLKVRAFNPVEVTGKADIQMSAYISTAGAGGSITAGGDLSVKLGQQEFGIEARTDEMTGKDTPKKEQIGKQGSEFLDLVYSILKTGDEADSDDNFDVKEGASYLELSSTIGFVIGQFTLAEDDNGPGLTLDISGLKIQWDPILKLTGKVDILDVVLIYFAAPVASQIRKIRARIAAGEAVSGKVEAYLKFEGSISLELGIKASNVVAFNPMGKKGETELKPDVKGGGKILGEGKLGISLKAESWFVKFESAVEGSINTSFLYEVKDEGDGAKCRKGFEGLYGDIKAHVKASIARKYERPADDKSASKPVSGDMLKGGVKREFLKENMSEWEDFNV